MTDPPIRRNCHLPPPRNKLDNPSGHLRRNQPVKFICDLLEVAGAPQVSASKIHLRSMTIFFAKSPVSLNICQAGEGTLIFKKYMPVFGLTSRSEQNFRSSVRGRPGKSESNIERAAGQRSCIRKSILSA